MNALVSTIYIRPHTAKDWKQVSSKELNQTWTQVIDFIYTVLGLVNLT